MQQDTSGAARPEGRVAGVVTRDLGDLDARPLQVVPWSVRVQNWLQHRRRELPAEMARRMLGRVSGILTMQSGLSGLVYRVDWSRLAPWQIQHLQALLRANHPLVDLPRFFGGQVLDYGLLSRRVVTTAGVGFIVDAFQNTVELENMKYHALGTNSTAENASDTAMGAEITSSHYSGGVRPTGTTTEGGSANIYRTVGTHTQTTAGDTITEHGPMSQAATGGGVLLDRSVFTGVALAVGDSFQTTYELTLSSGG